MKRVDYCGKTDINMKLQDPSSCPLCGCCYFVKIPPGWFWSRAWFNFPWLLFIAERNFNNFKCSIPYTKIASLLTSRLKNVFSQITFFYHCVPYPACTLLLLAIIIRWEDLTTCTSSTSILICVPIIRTLQNTYPECAARRVWLVLLSQVLQAYSVCCKYHQ